jgi:hypothetical protein
MRQPICMLMESSVRLQTRQGQSPHKNVHNDMYSIYSNYETLYTSWDCLRDRPWQHATRRCECDTG